MLKALPLFLLALCIPASSQTEYVNGPSGNCSVTTQYSAPAVTYYCTAAQVFVGGVFDGYIGFWFILQPDNTFTAGHVYREDVHGTSVFTADDFAGSFSGTATNNLLTGVVTGTYLGGLGSASETMAIKNGSCYRGTCRKVNYISSGSGSN